MSRTLNGCGGMIGILGTAVLAVVVPAGSATAQATKGGFGDIATTVTASKLGNRAPELAATPDQWINSPPISLDAIKGKGVVLCFFEVSAAKTKAGWPKVFEVTKPTEGQPIIYIGVNSADSRQAVQQYAQQVNLEWPIMLDPSRSFEKQCEVGTIGADNPIQLCVIAQDSKLQKGDWSQWALTITKALKDAKWNVDPKEVPEALNPAWYAVEFGNDAQAATVIKKSLTSNKADIKQGAEKLKAAVQTKIDALAADAKKALDAGKKYDAYAIYVDLADQFKGYDLPPEATSAHKELAKDAEVKAALLAKKSLDNAKRLLAGGKAPARKQAATMLKKVADDMAANSLGEEAKALLAQLEAAP